MGYLFPTPQNLSHKRNVSSISDIYRYLHGKSSDKHHSLVPPTQTFAATAYLAISRPQYPLYSFGKKSAHFESVFSRIALLRADSVRYNLSSSRMNYSIGS